jgi:ABC-type molybdate transport system ATPase subunit
MPILTASFSLVIALIASLDRPDSGRLQVSQQALENARAAMGAPTEIPAGGNQAP